MKTPLIATSESPQEELLRLLDEVEMPLADRTLLIANPSQVRLLIFTRPTTCPEAIHLGLGDLIDGALAWSTDSHLTHGITAPDRWVGLQWLGYYTMGRKMRGSRIDYDPLAQRLGAARLRSSRWPEPGVRFYYDPRAPYPYWTTVPPGTRDERRR